MKIYDLKINNKKQPIGFDLSDLRISWKVDAGSDNTVNTRIIIATDSEFNDVVYDQNGEFDQLSTLIDLDLKTKTRYYVQIISTQQSGQIIESNIEFFETGIDEWKASWITTCDEHLFHPRFSYKFKSINHAKSAKLYISGLGLYNALINDQPVSDEVLTPYYSNYNYEVQYQTFDVTNLISECNTIAVDLGNGWYKGNFGLQHKAENFGNKFKLIAQLEITYEDGSRQLICTNDEWQYTESQYEVTDIYDGETIDFTKQISDRYQAVLTDVKAPLIDRFSLPVKEMEVVAIKEIITTPKGETVIDFGQNFAGYVKIKDDQSFGTKVTLDFGEIMQDDNFYNDNYRSAKSKYTYISDGTSRIITPKFTFFGFRYVRVSGLQSEININNFIGCALYSEADQTGMIETDNKNVNKLFSNAMWGQKSNSIDFPTDCPQRDERLGWTGDVMAFAGTASYNMDVLAFYDKFLTDLRTEQIELDGIVPGVIPVFEKDKAIFSSVWGDIATFLPIHLYEVYGDITIVEKYFAMMKDWVDKITREDINRGQQYLFNFNHHIGDWLAVNGRTSQSNQGETDMHFIASCYYAESVNKLIQACELLGKDELILEYRKLHQNIVEVIKVEYFTSSGRLAIDTQTAYYVALKFNIYVDREQVIKGLRTRLYNDCYKITGGFVGAPMMCKTLADNGFEAEAMYVLLQEDYPGWMHCVNLGATTIWERWNSVLDNGVMSGTMMNSLNHYAFGGVVEYIYANIAGLTSMAPGFKSAKIQPTIDYKIGNLKASYNSASGLWTVKTKINDDHTVTIKVDVPTDTTAILVLPFSAQEEKHLTSGEHSFTYMPTINVRAKYTTKTLFKDMISDPAVKEIIGQECPILGFFLDVVGDEYLYDNLETISNMSYMGIDPTDVERASLKILKLEME